MWVIKYHVYHSPVLVRIWVYDHRSLEINVLGDLKKKKKKNLFAEYILRNAGDDTTLMAESEEELKNLLMKVKEESDNVGLKLNFFSLLFHFHQEAL